MATNEQARDIDPHTAVESLRAALDGSGIVLPSLSVDYVSPDLKLIDLGRIRADVAMRLAEALRRGDPAA
ncbi:MULTISPECIES: hypothetical protein [unclassified Streptomyces]|uniref:Uncharacterized protein n=1 Tax=Streptomyces sp. SID12501 TaxID=2706042 RepID=A0A6B3C199_9ACTN|nr:MULTISPECIES: hypothetical protein [unclassified Streptomyces]NEA67562.1 hypothetical protein [Streptomyces sp. SID12488]NEC90487.1 hypothetical protein [Streptomyces sp. SID12501]